MYCRYAILNFSQVVPNILRKSTVASIGGVWGVARPPKESEKGLSSAVKAL